MPDTPVTSFRVDSTLTDAEGTLGFQVRVADPAWMLARQRQMGELSGQDAGSPVAAGLWTRRTRLTRFRAAAQGAAAGSALASEPVPIEVRAENELDMPSLRWRAVAAADYARRVAAIGDRASLRAYRAALAARYRLTVPDGTDPVQAALARASFDGQALYAELDASVRGPTRTLPDQPPLSEADRAAVLPAAKAFLAWFDALTGRSVRRERAWRPDRLEYQMALAGPTASGELVLAATECDDGRLDWSDFDVVPGTLDAGGDDPGSGEPEVSRFVPMPVHYRGKPASRFWDFELDAVHFGGVAANAEELATLLVVDFALRYDDDFFIVPLPIEVGAIVRVAAIDVTDSFGRRTLLRTPAEAKDRLRAFEHSVVAGPNAPQVPAREDAMVLFPALVAPLEGEPIEVLGVVRDEMANLAWAVERVAPGPDGSPVDQEARAAIGRPPPAPPTPPTDGPTLLRYAMRSPVPANWHALVRTTDDENRLQVGALPPIPGEPARVTRSRLLGELNAPPGLAAEEVTRHPRDVILAWQCARDANGRQHVWLGRRVRSHSHAGLPPLEWDLATPPE